MYSVPYLVSVEENRKGDLHFGINLTMRATSGSGNEAVYQVMEILRCRCGRECRVLCHELPDGALVCGVALHPLVDGVEGTLAVGLICIGHGQG